MFYGQIYNCLEIHYSPNMKPILLKSSTGTETTLSEELTTGADFFVGLPHGQGLGFSVCWTWESRALHAGIT